MFAIVRRFPLEARKAHAPALLTRIGEKQAGDDCREDNLEKELKRAVDPFGFLLGNLEVIIGEPKPPEVNHAEEREPDEFIVERAQRMLDTSTAPITSTPPIVGVPCFTLWSSASRWTSAAPRIGCSTFSARSFAIMKFQNVRVSKKAVTAAAMARKVT